jgi:2-polyprenyl-6-methoxyphenol hydroxylase-like FAD-dependent oxidoreductase
MTAFDVSIQGSGPVGLCLALALSRQGLSVAWRGAKRPSAPAEAASTTPTRAGADVRTYALSGGSVDLLQQLKVWPAIPEDAKTAVADMRIFGDASGAMLQFSAAEQQRAALAWIVDAAALEAALLTAVGFAPHVEQVDVDVPAALTAYAEGRDGTSRQQLGVQMPRHLYGQRALAARLVTDRTHDGVAWQWFRSPDVLALLPFDRPTAGSSFGLVWSLPEQRANELQALDEAGFEAALNDATGGVVGRLQLSSVRATWPLMQAQADRVCDEGWVLLGDAAHVVHPLAGQGLNLGLADVQALAETLAGRESFRSLGDARLLRRYARRRQSSARLMGVLTDGLLELFAHPNPAVRELRNRGLSLLNGLPPIKRLLTDRAWRS